jgi:hypothetical protein
LQSSSAQKPGAHPHEAQFYKRASLRLTQGFQVDLEIASFICALRDQVKSCFVNPVLQRSSHPAIVTLAFIPTYLDASQEAYIPEKYKRIILNAPEPDFPVSTSLRQLGQGIYRLRIRYQAG